MSNQRLNQFADAIANARATGTFGDAEAAEQQLLGVLLDIAPELDHTTVGAAWLVIGNLFRSNLDQAPAHLQGDTAINLMNLVQLAGQRLYAGAPLTHPCPIPRSNGTACRFTAKGARQEVLDAMMRAHVDVYHPGRAWPPEADEPGVHHFAKCERCTTPVGVYADGSTEGGVDTLAGVLCDRCVVLDAAVELGEPTPPPRCTVCEQPLGLNGAEWQPTRIGPMCQTCFKAWSEAGEMAQVLEAAIEKRQDAGADVAPDRLTPEGWCGRYGFDIADPDGWRGPDDPAWEEPITLEEFIPRLNRSTARTPIAGELRMQRDLETWQERRRLAAATERSYTLDEAMAHPGGIDALTGGAIRHMGFSVEGDEDGD